MLQGDFFEAHEILEVPWRENHDPRLRTVIWVAAAFVHWQRDHTNGATRLFQRVYDHVADPARAEVKTWLDRVQSGRALRMPTPGALTVLEAWARTGPTGPASDETTRV